MTSGMSVTIAVCMRRGKMDTKFQRAGPEVFWCKCTELARNGDAPRHFDATI